MVVYVFLGDTLWEGKGKTHLMTVKEATRDGGVLEFTYSASLVGTGKAKGLDVTLTFTGVKSANSLGAGPTIGSGVFFSKEGNMVAVNSVGYGKPRRGRARSIEIWSFNASADSLKWLNDTVATVSIDGDDQWREFTIKIDEWDPER